MPQRGRIGKIFGAPQVWAALSGGASHTKVEEGIA
jgi:hypothetical protein